MDDQTRSPAGPESPETAAPPSERPPADRTHMHIPAGFLTLIGGSLAWFVAMGWLAYATGLDGEFAMLIVSVFAVVAIGVPALLVVAGRGSAERASAARARPWLRGFFVTWTGTIRAREALVQVLLPITATAIGFTLIAVVLAFVHAGAATHG